MKISHTAPKRIAEDAKLKLATDFALAISRVPFANQQAVDLAWIAAVVDYPRSQEIYTTLANMVRQEEALKSIME